MDVCVCSHISLDWLPYPLDDGIESEKEMNYRRTKTQIYIDILRSVQRANGRLKKTHIVYKANLTHSRLQPYLDFLLSKGFLAEEKKGNQTFFIITERGVKFLGEVYKLKEISDAFGVPL